VPDPVVSFVVLSYNFGRYLGQCLDSILGQDGDHDFEVIVVDDASTDDTARLLDDLRDPRIRVIRHPRNAGHIATVTDGLTAARGRYVARIDGDDRYFPCFLNVTVPILERNPEVGLVFADAALINEDGQRSEQPAHSYAPRDSRGNLLVALLEQNFICAPTVIARRDAWLRCLPVPAGLAFHDWYFTVRIAREHELYYAHRTVADYRVHSANLHVRIVRDRSEEPSILGVLDRVFSEPERTAELERHKQRARRRIYGNHYLTLADKYFGMGMNGDARRCYVAALRHSLRLGLQPAVQRRLAATLVGRARYDRGKRWMRATLGQTEA